MKRGMTVYVITKGTYSDYRICAVTLDKSKAKRLAMLHSDEYKKADIEEYETESEMNVNMLNGRKPYYVYFYRERKPWAYCMAGSSEIREGIIENVSKNTDLNMTIALFAESEEEALKIAQDKRAHYLAERAGVV